MYEHLNKEILRLPFKAEWLLYVPATSAASKQGSVVLEFSVILSLNSDYFLKQH
jgi:hypothetical protein